MTKHRGDFGTNVPRAKKHAPLREVFSLSSTHLLSSSFERSVLRNISEENHSSIQATKRLLVSLEVGLKQNYC